MADLQGTKVIATIVPSTTDDTFATHDAVYGKGGWRELDTIADRDTLPRSRMRQGMVVYVKANGKNYQLAVLGNRASQDVWEELRGGDVRLTQAEYDALASSHNIDNVQYMVVDNNGLLQKIYYGYTLIAERSAESQGFVYNFGFRFG